MIFGTYPIVSRNFTPEIVYTFHSFVHFVTFLIAIMIIIYLKYENKVNKEPLWIMGMLSIIVHVLMDLFIIE
jgi:membrane-bound metal-dependent hydrolase YbcI (DUF457 family)